MIQCINYSHPKIKVLVEKLGKDKTIDIFIENNYSIPEDISLYIGNDSVKSGVQELFDSNPELANIGTQEQYSQYLDTIFPDSKVKDIVYHGSIYDNKQKFKESTRVSGNYFAVNPNEALQHAERQLQNKKDAVLYSILLNIKNPKIITKPIDYEDLDTEVKIYKGDTVFGTDYDAIIAEKVEEYNATKSAETVWLEKQIVIFEPEQAHILGSKQDIEGFKSFTKNTALSLEPSLDLPKDIQSIRQAEKLAMEYTVKYPNATFHVMDFYDGGQTTYYLVKKPKRYSVSTKLIEIMSKKMGLNYLYISESELARYEVPNNTNSFVRGKTVYLVKERVNDLVAIEEFLHPFVKAIQLENPKLFYDLLDNAKQISYFSDLIANIEKEYGAIPGYDVENEIVTQILSDQVLTNFQDNGMDEIPADRIQQFANAVNSVVSSIANSIMKFLKELGFPISPKQLDDFRTIRSMAALVTTAGTKFETASVGTMLNLTDVQKQVVGMLDVLESKVTNQNNEYIVKGYTNKWQRPSQLSKNVIKADDINDELGENMKTAGNRLHDFMQDIITKAFPEANTHNKPITLDIEEVKHYEEVKQFLEEHVINPAKKEGAILRAEAFVANEDLNIAGRVDLLRINQDGSFRIYDLKSRYRKEQTGKRRINKILEWTKQTGFYKQLLSTPNKIGTPIGVVESVKVIELEASQYQGEVKKIKGIGMVATVDEKTGIEALDDLIAKLYNQINILKSKVPVSEVQKIAHDKLLSSRIELVQALQLNQDYTALISHINQELFILNELITSGEIDKDSQSIMSDLKLFSLLSKFIDETVLEKNQITQLYNLQGKAVSLLAKFEALAADKIKKESTRVGVLGRISNDVFAAVKDVSSVYKYLSGAATIDSPLVQTAYRVFNERKNKALMKSKEAYNAIQEAVNNLKQQLGELDYSLFINTNGNSSFLVDKYQYEFFKQAKANKGDETWFKNNATFDKEKYDQKYQFQIDYLNRFEKAKRQEILESIEDKEIANKEAYVEKAYQTYRKAELTKWIAKNKSITEFHIPKDNWIDPKWRDIKEGKYKGTAVEEFYDLYKSFLEEAKDIAPDYVSPRFIPNFSSSFVEKVSKMGVLGGLQDSWSTLLTDLDTSYDLNYGLKDAITGETIRSLSVPGINNKVDNQSLDLGLSMQMFMEGVYKYKELSEIEETMIMAKHFVRNGKVLKTDLKGNTSEISAINSQMAESFDAYVDAVLYGVKKTDLGGTKIKGGEGVVGKAATLVGLLPEGDTVLISWARVVDKLLKYTSLKNLSFNLFSPLTNLLAGTANLYASGFGGRYYNSEDLNWAITAVTSNDLTEEGKLCNKIFEYLDLNANEIQFRNNKLSKYTIDKITEKYNGMTMMRMSEEALYKAAVMAMLKSNKYNIKLSDFKLENGKLVASSAGSEALTRSLFKAKTVRVAQLAFGAMNDDDFILANKSILGRMLIQHRSWLPQMFMERFGSKRYDYVLEEQMEGRYRTLARIVGNYLSKQQTGNLSELDKYNLKASSMELGLLLAVGLLLKALSAGLDDDDKKDAWYKYTSVIGQRTMAELGFFIPLNVSAQSQILLHPAASISLIDDYGRFANAIWKETTGDEKERKKAKPLKAAGKLVPVVGQVQRFIDELFNINLSK